MRRGLLTILAMTLMLVTLTGCGLLGSNNGNPDGFYSQEVKLPAGGHVLCVAVQGGQGAGVSCDWGHADE